MRFSFSAAAAIFFVFCTTAFALESAQRIPMGDSDGPLSAGLTNVPLGTAKVFGAKEDIFVKAGGFSSKHGIRLFRRGGTAEDGAAVFELAAMTTLGGKPFDKSNYGTVTQAPDGTIYGFWKNKKEIIPTKFDPKTSDFVPTGAPIHYDQGGGITALANADGSFAFFFSQTVGGPLRPEGPGHRDPEYRPFDAAGIWTGNFPYGYVKSAKLASIDAGKFSDMKDASLSRKEMLLGISGLNAYRTDDGQPRLIIGGAMGLFADYAVQKDGTLGPQLLVRGPDGLLLRHPAIHASPVFYENGVIAGGESALYCHAFAKRADDGTPQTAPVVYARETNTLLYAGTLPVVNACDWDGDGLTDLVVGNSQGEVLFFKNIGSAGDPKFTQPSLVEAAGEPIRVQSGYWGVQGPGESRWGYVGPNVYDWNGDGLPDILMNDATSRHSVYFNRGTKTAPALEAAKLLYCEGMEMHGTWRTRPAVGKLAGRNAYVGLDDNDALHLYWQIDALNLADGGKLTLADGSAITANFLPAGATGRAKLILTDIDGDGKTDLLVGTPRHGSFPDKENGLPQRLGLPGAAVLFLKNIGTDQAPVFDAPRMMRFKGDLKEKRLTTFGHHECSADVADFGNGVRGIVVGDEEGRLRFFNEKDIVWEIDPPALPKKKPAAGAAGKNK